MHIHINAHLAYRKTFDQHTYFARLIHFLALYNALHSLYSFDTSYRHSEDVKKYNHWAISGGKCIESLLLNV